MACVRQKYAYWKDGVKQGLADASLFVGGNHNEPNTCGAQFYKFDLRTFVRVCII
jgi:hypothetical protein